MNHVGIDYHRRLDRPYPDYAYYSLSNMKNPLSLEETQEKVETHFKSFPDYRWKIEELYAVKDRVIARISTSSTFTEKYFGIPPTGKKIASSGISIVRMENGKVVEERKEVNSLGSAEKLFSLSFSNSFDSLFISRFLCYHICFMLCSRLSLDSSPECRL